jgi:hypothetical protein
VPDIISLRDLIQKSLRNNLTPEEQHQLDNWEPADLERLLSEEFADVDDFKRNFSLYLQAERLSAELQKEFVKKYFPKL